MGSSMPANSCITGLSDALHISMSGPPACPAQLCVPDWPMFNRNKLKWLPPLYKDGEVKEKEA